MARLSKQDVEKIVGGPASADLKLAARIMGCPVWWERAAVSLDEIKNCAAGIGGVDLVDFISGRCAVCVGRGEFTITRQMQQTVVDLLPPPCIWMIHGRSQDWRIVAECIENGLGLRVAEFERELTAGLSVIERVWRMLESVCFAIAVMSAEDRQPDGTVRTRQNVVHEIGLAQGRLGRDKALVLVEEGVDSFSNIDGMIEVRYEPGDIRGALGRVQDRIRRANLHRGSPETI